MANWLERFPLNKRVMTPLGSGKVIGYVHRLILEIVVSLDNVPSDTFDKGGVVVSIHCFRPGVLKEVTNEK